MRRLARRAAALLFAGTTGCLTTRVVASDPTATVWVDGRASTGEARLAQLGPPHHARILVRTADGRTVQAELSRTPATALAWSLYTGGLCLLVCWSYPARVEVAVPRAASSWDADPEDDPWLRPPPGWRPPERPADPWGAPPAR